MTEETEIFTELSVRVEQREKRMNTHLSGGFCLYLPLSYNAPPKPRVGQLAYADGTDWNPGSGEGLYVYKSTGWVLIA